MASDSSGIQWLRLRYRSVTQYQDYRTLRMVSTEEVSHYALYEVTIPAEHVAAEWDFMYFFEVMDNAGNGRIYPDLEKEAPYVIVPLER